jgi:hypothetical protein
MACDDCCPENGETLRAEDADALRESEALIAEIGLDRLIAWAKANPPPQSWFDEDLDGLFGEGDPP